MDLFPTFAAIVGGKVPDDRVIDGVDQSDFFRGEQEKSNRESFVVYVGNDVFGVKWRNWENDDQGTQERIRGADTRSTPCRCSSTCTPTRGKNTRWTPRWWQTGWVRWPAGQVLVDHIVTLKKEPPIRPGTQDPYSP